MTNILLLTSSPRGNASYSTQVAAEVVGDLQQAIPDTIITRRDLAHSPLPHIDENFVAALSLAPEARSAGQSAQIARSDALIDELVAADILVIASPMYNFGLPSTLKAWIDHVCRAGRTFHYSEIGPQGLLFGKRAILVQSRGGVYSSGPASVHEHQEAHLRSVLALIGITDVETIDVEGVAISPDTAARALAAGVARAHEIVTRAV